MRRLLRLGLIRGRRRIVVELGVGVWEGLLVGMHREAVVAWWRARGRRWVVVPLCTRGLLGVSHDDVQDCFAMGCGVSWMARVTMLSRWMVKQDGMDGLEWDVEK